MRARRCRLVVVVVEVGGRFGAEAATWLRMLAKQHASDVQAAMRAAARAAWVARWSGLLAVAAQRAVAASCCATSPEKGRICTKSVLTCAGSFRRWAAAVGFATAVEGAPP